jgi:amidohydrolase
VTRPIPPSSARPSNAFILALVAAIAGLTATALAFAAAAPAARPRARAYDAEISRRAEAVEKDVIAWRRDIHQHPELSNREFRTSKLVAEKLTAMGLEVRTGVAKTGVVALLRGASAGPVVALRADMDALPVTEEVDLPFASKARGTYNGQDVGVMHACGHDSHTAMLLGVAQVLSGMKAQLKGTVKFIFQPCEEGAPEGETGGARIMVEEGVLRDPAPAAIFGMHVTNSDFGTISYRPEGELAASDRLRFVVRGVQTHGGRPWEGVDPIVVGSQIVLGLQTIVSRQSDVTLAPVVLSIGSIHGGVRNNIIPDSLVMEGTLRTYDSGMRDGILVRIRRTAEDIAASAGATARFEVLDSNPVTWNDAALTSRMAPSLARVVGAQAVRVIRPRTYSEDFAYYAQKIPGFYVFLGVNPPGRPEEGSAPNHSPRFFVDEQAMVTGVRIMSTLAMDYLSGAADAAGPRAERQATR